MQANRLVIVTGLSGSGKSTALKSFEDMGYFCVDNLPVPLITNFVDFLIDIPDQWAHYPSSVRGDMAPQVTKNPSSKWRFALLVDCREEKSFPDIFTAIEKLKNKGTEVSFLYLDCSDEALVHRFRETRRPHPLLMVDQKLKTLSEGINKERNLLAPFRAVATRVIDTSSFSPHDLRREIEGFFEFQVPLQITISSFGFKYGLPYDADLIVDVRFLKNPYFVKELKDKTGDQEEVRNYVFQSPDTEQFIKHYMDLLKFLLPRYQQEGKRYLSIGVGCTGGKHRSVAIAVKLTELLEKENFSVNLNHRDITRGKIATC